jgi:hypothetical protein
MSDVILRMPGLAKAAVGAPGRLCRGPRQDADEARARRALRMRAARENAGRREDFAPAGDALLGGNTRARRAGEGVRFSLPKLTRSEPAGDDAEAEVFPVDPAFLDLTPGIAAANRNVGATCRGDDHAGHEEGRMVLAYRANGTAAAAPTLAQRDRTPCRAQPWPCASSASGGTFSSGPPRPATRHRTD